MKSTVSAHDAGTRLFWTIAIVLLLLVPHLTGEQGFVAAIVLVAAYGALFKGARLATLVLTSTFILIAAGAVVFLLAR